MGSSEVLKILGLVFKLGVDLTEKNVAGAVVDGEALAAEVFSLIKSRPAVAAALAAKNS